MQMCWTGPGPPASGTHAVASMVGLPSLKPASVTMLLSNSVTSLPKLGIVSVTPGSARASHHLSTQLLDGLDGLFEGGDGVLFPPQPELDPGDGVRGSPKFLIDSAFPGQFFGLRAQTERAVQFAPDEVNLRFIGQNHGGETPVSVLPRDRQSFLIVV